ncbi:Isochorismatase hydrolase [Patellaria atrata CBS 101060]|uniref:Isochorismatase hydrolase n=1 Tax=Patellaria atrata CBS 101060 TaxID=1346257 RepID=A0A9P4S9C0_9PEZI|nr:Isochorismatase hydrolase [Patellaria atrata CBS 101060]
MTTALLVIDMQVVFTPLTHTALPIILTLASYFRTQDLPLLFTQHGHPPADLTPPLTNQLVRKWGVRGSIHTNSPPWELLPAIKTLVEDTSSPVVGKNTYDAFLNTELEGLLRERNVKRVVVTGVLTDCCVDTSARAAFNRGFETWVVRDAVGTGEGRGERALEAWEFGYGDVVSAEEVVGRLEGEREREGGEEGG